MKFRKRLEIALLMLYCKLCRKRMPLFVSWAITHKCNHHCGYCDIPDLETKELTTSQVFDIIDELYAMGTKVIFFTGGEPLLRKDIERVIDYCKNKGLYVGISSNGDLVRKKIDDIRKVDMLQLSFDGPKEIHDRQRGKGSYDSVIEAIRIAKKNKIESVVLNSTITRYNYKFIDYILQIAKKYDVKVSFEPVDYMPLGKKNVGIFLLRQENRKKVFNYLIKKKKEGSAIENTVAGLEYFRDYPTKEKIDCGAFRISCVITPDGNLFPCSFLENKIKPYNCIEFGFKEAFTESKPITCESCLCNKILDLSKLFSLNLTAIIDIINSSLK
jgi:MoaA/NifB/PqqE/SkfB family radical SAM enzyme